MSANCRSTFAFAVQGRPWKSQVSFDAYKAATRPKMARRLAPVAVMALAAPSKGADSLVDSVGAPVPEGWTMGVVALAEG